MGLLIVALTRANSGWPPRDLDSGVWLGAARHASQQRTHRTTSKENDKWYLTFAHIGAVAGVVDHLGLAGRRKVPFQGAQQGGFAGADPAP
jgi:hypothetical protein